VVGSLLACDGSTADIPIGQTRTTYEEGNDYFIHDIISNRMLGR
jgi:hypothetical protein